MLGCTNVVSLPESFCRLSNLKKLNLSCTLIGESMKLESLPERFGQLRSLVILNLEGCKKLEALPEGMPPCILRLSAALAILA